jgi:hypothetical protein
MYYINVEYSLFFIKKTFTTPEVNFFLIFGQSILGILKMDKKNVQKSKIPKQSCKKNTFVTIIHFFGKDTKKIIFIL